MKRILCPRHLLMLGVFLLWTGVAAPQSPSGELLRIQTDDGMSLHGVRWFPPGGGRLGVALFSGTGSEFYDDLLTGLGERFAAAGYPAVSLNRRDHGDNFGYYRLEPAALDHGYSADLRRSREV